MGDSWPGAVRKVRHAPNTHPRKTTPTKPGRLQYYSMITPLHRLWAPFRREIPRLGLPGSRSAGLHVEPTQADTAARDDAPAPPTTPAGEAPTAPPPASQPTPTESRVFFALRWLGTVGAFLISVGGLGAGALPVVGNPFDSLPLGSVMSRMLQTSSALTMAGVGLLVTAWLLMAPLVGVPLWGGWRRFTTRRDDSTAPDPARASGVVSVRQLWATYAGWVIPLILTAPLFTQDIYSYLAQGSIAAHGMDPYAAGPVQLLGADNELARSVPFIWANSPSPYGPVATGIAAAISPATHDSILFGVIAHRLLAVCGVALSGWAIVRLARRCHVVPAAALWLGILNPISVLHLIGGIHNEAIMLGCILTGMELSLAALDRLAAGTSWLRTCVPMFTCGGALISCAGMVKVTGFIALGFAGMALARTLMSHRGWGAVRAVAAAAAFQLAVLLGSIALVTAVTGVGLGWLGAQGGAATVRSWLSLSTAVGVAWGFLGMLLGLGDHTDAILGVTRTTGVFIALVFLIRMLRATLRGTIHPVGGLGIATFVLVVFFPVVQPWYVLWAIFPLAPWANRFIFRVWVIGYSAVMSIMVLPRGLGLPPGTVAVIYAGAVLSFLAILWLWRAALSRFGERVLH